jgi:hypothetical protein
VPPTGTGSTSGTVPEWASAAVTPFSDHGDTASGARLSGEVLQVQRPGERQQHRDRLVNDQRAGGDADDPVQRVVDRPDISGVSRIGHLPGVRPAMRRSPR